MWKATCHSFYNRSMKLSLDRPWQVVEKPSDSSLPAHSRFKVGRPWLWIRNSCHAHFPSWRGENRGTFFWQLKNYVLFQIGFPPPTLSLTLIEGFISHPRECWEKSLAFLKIDTSPVFPVWPPEFLNGRLRTGNCWFQWLGRLKFWNLQLSSGGHVCIRKGGERNLKHLVSPWNLISSLLFNF